MAWTDNLISVWTCDETSGNLIDQYGSNDLTDNGTVGASAAGYINGHRTFTNAGTEYFSKADNTDLSTGDIDFEFVARVYMTDITTYYCPFVTKMHGTDHEYQFFYNKVSARFSFTVFVSNTGYSIAADTLGAPTEDTWYTIRCWHDATANEIGIQVDGGAADTTAHTLGVDDSDSAFEIGGRSGLPWYHEGGIDFVAFWKRRLTSDEWADIYNERLGLPFDPSNFGSLPLADVATESIDTDGFTENVHNAAHFRTPIASMPVGGTTYQVVAYWDDAATPELLIGERDITSSSWTVRSTSITFADTTDDVHDTVSVGIDPDGYVHVCYEHHNTAIRYAKSNAALGTWTGTMTTGLSMVGTNETQVTYPFFFNDPSDNLYFMFRDGWAVAGDWYLYKYTHGTTTWAAATGTGSGGMLTYGSNETPTLGGYMLNEPCFDSDFGSGGYLHFGFAWAESDGNDNDSFDVIYFKWDGTNWTQSDGASQTMPVTPSNDEVVDPEPQSGAILTGLIARGNIYSDSFGYPHMVYLKTDGSTNRQIYHTWFNGSSWATSELTSHTANTGGMPKIAIDRDTNTVFIWFNPTIAESDAYGNDPVVTVYKSYAGGFTQWEASTFINTNASGCIFFDRRQWEQDNSELHIPFFPVRGTGATNTPADGYPVRLAEKTKPAAIGPVLSCSGGMLGPIG